MVKPVVQAKAPAPKNVSQMSKKERQLLKQKELEDLDALLSEFKDTSVESGSEIAVPPAVAAPATASSSAEGGAKDDSKKKKKKKKSAAGGAGEAVSSEAKADDAVETEDAEGGVAADVASVLKAKLASKKPAKKSSVSEVQRIALAEAQKAIPVSDGKKKDKKKDRSKYNEWPNF